MKAEKGITLVALVVTIIVLLILAIVTISIVWKGKIMDYANEGVTSYNEAQINEAEQLNSVEKHMANYATPTQP